MTLYVAVIDDATAIDFASGRPAGDWAAFIGPDKDAVIRQALEARQAWGSQVHGRRYRVLVGTLTGEVRQPYEVVELGGSANEETA